MRELLSLMGLFSVCHTSLVLQPILVGAFVDYKSLSEKLAGFIAAAEMGGFCLSIIATIPWIARIDRRRLAWLGIAIYVLANALTIWVDGMTQLLLARVFVGLGGGVCFATFNAVLARSTEPDRTIASVMIAAGIHTAFLLWLFPILILKGGIAAVMLGQCANAVIFALLVSYLPRHAPKETSVLSESGMLIGWSIVFILVALLLLHAGHTAIWAYIERIGNSININAKTIGLMLGSASLLAIIGSALASWLGCRYGRLIPNVITLSLLCMSVLCLVNNQHHLIYLAALITFKVSWFFGIPFLVGLCAVFDKKGRGTVLAGFMAMAGSALGPAMGAEMVDKYSYSGLGWLSISCYMLCFLLSARLLFIVDKKLSLFPKFTIPGVVAMFQSK